MSNSDITDPNLATPEGRSAIDTPISETELENFDKFYRDFLRKRLEDKLSLLKGISLLRRGDLRQYVQFAVLFQNRYESLIPLKQRDMLLSFPSVNKEIYGLMFSCAQSYGLAGETAVLLTKNQIGEHLDRTEMFRIDLDTLLASAEAITPENRAMLAEYFAEAKKGATEKAFKFTLVILADHAMISILPNTERNSTIAVGQIRAYLEKRFPKKLEENLIEFFAVGGGFIRADDKEILIGGRSNVFDPTFGDIGSNLSDLYAGQYLNVKYQLAEQILKTEFPEYVFKIKQSPTGHLIKNSG